MKESREDVARIVPDIKSFESRCLPKIRRVETTLKTQVLGAEAYFLESMLLTTLNMVGNISGKNGGAGRGNGSTIVLVNKMEKLMGQMLDKRMSAGILTDGMREVQALRDQIRRIEGRVASTPVRIGDIIIESQNDMASWIFFKILP